MTRANLPIIIAVAVVTITLWAMADRPEQHLPWTDQVEGFSFSPPLIIFVLLPLSLFVFKTAKQFYLYQTHTDANLLGGVYAGIAGLASSHTVSKAILSGFIHKGMSFLRTLKMADRLCYCSAMLMVNEEAILVLLFMLAVVGVLVQQGADSSDILFWVVTLCVQAIPYASAVFMSLLSAKVHGSKKTLGMTKSEGIASQEKSC